MELLFYFNPTNIKLVYWVGYRLSRRPEKSARGKDKIPQILRRRTSGAALRNQSPAVGFKQQGQGADLAAQLGADIGIRHEPSAGGNLEDVGGRENVGILLHRIDDAGERPVGHQPHPVGVVDQGIARDAGCVLIGLAEAAVDGQHPAVAFDRAFARPLI